MVDFIYLGDLEMSEVVITNHIADNTMRVKALVRVLANPKTGEKKYNGMAYLCPLCNKLLSDEYNPEIKRCTCGAGVNWGASKPRITKETVFRAEWDD